MLHPSTTTQFERDKTKARQQGRDLTRLTEVMGKLIKEHPLEAKHRDHPLKGDWKGFRDCHVMGDWVLIYKIDKENNTQLKTGQHHFRLMVDRPHET